MATRPVPSADTLTVIPLVVSEDVDVAIVMKPFAGEVWSRDYATPDTDVGATQLTSGAQFTALGLSDLTPIPVGTLPVP